MAFVNNRDDPKGNWFTIDEERGYVFKNIWGPTPDGAYIFQLEMEGKTVEVQTDGSPVQKRPGPPGTPLGRLYDMTYNFRRFSVPDGISLSRAEIAEIIKEALVVYGDNYHQERGHIITVNFDPKLIF